MLEAAAAAAIAAAIAAAAAAAAAAGLGAPALSEVVAAILVAGPACEWWV